MKQKEEATKDQLYKEIVYLSGVKRYSIEMLLLAGGIGYFVCLTSIVVAYTLLYS